MSHQRQTSGGSSSFDPAAAQQYYQQQQQAQMQQPYHMGIPSMGHAQPLPLQHHHDPSLAHQQPMQPQHQHLLQSFWINQMNEVENVPHDFKLHHLPLARIKKVMKTDEDVKAKMISAEAPMIFDKGCEIFITELTLRAWIHAEENKRRTLQRSDIAAAITKTDMFDFLIDIVPREEYKMAKEHKPSATAAATAAAEHRRSQESFPSLGPTAPPTGSSSGMNPGFEGYGYPYGVVENGSFTMGSSEALDPYRQQQQQQQLQLQYMRAQMTQGGHSQLHPHQQQRYEYQGQPPPSHSSPESGNEGTLQSMSSEAW